MSAVHALALADSCRQPPAVARPCLRTLCSVVGSLAIFAAPAMLSAQEIHNSALHTFRVVTVAEGLVNPWSMAWLPNGDMLVTERPGRLRVIRDGKLLPDAVPGVPAVRVVGQGGLQDVVVHPDFASNGLVYLSFAKPNADGSQGTTAVVRGRFENDRLNNVEEIFEAAPYSGSPGHYGARMVFDGKGHLFLSSGDRMAPSTGNLAAHPAQVASDHHGSILRLNEDGSVPSDNPFVGKADVRPEIWTTGNRNPQGLALNPVTGDLWETEHGPQGGDELNLILPGVNYGWPVITYGMNYGVGTDIGGREREGMQQPAAFWVPSIAPSGLMIYTGDKFPMWKGNAFAGGLSAGYRQLSRIMLDGTRVTNREPLLQGEMRIRDVRQGPDGFIYIATDNTLGNPTPIVRLEPA
ncbi:MAG TPA: PQQ-dependent sugar dehydrogenase, partial [Gammaproteobacteria bacterium]|nr:PQQ-dependent sugar dehydrogenase [Gammaproteobacteria bacterium]